MLPSFAKKPRMESAAKCLEHPSYTINTVPKVAKNNLVKNDIIELECLGPYDDNIYYMYRDSCIFVRLFVEHRLKLVVVIPTLEPGSSFKLSQLIPLLVKVYGGSMVSRMGPENDDSEVLAFQRTREKPTGTHKVSISIELSENMVQLPFTGDERSFKSELIAYYGKVHGAIPDDIEWNFSQYQLICSLLPLLCWNSYVVEREHNDSDYHLYLHLKKEGGGGGELRHLIVSEEDMILAWPAFLEAHVKGGKCSDPQHNGPVRALFPSESKVARRSVEFYDNKLSVDAYKYNETLNDSEYLDHHFSLPLLRLWIRSTSKLAAEDKIRSASFPLCQSSGMGKTKMVGQLCRSRNDEQRYWTIHLVCREAQGMAQSPIVRYLFNYLKSLPVSQSNMSDFSKDASREDDVPVKNSPVDSAIGSLAVEILKIVSRFIQALLLFEGGQELPQVPSVLPIYWDFDYAYVTDYQVHSVVSILSEGNEQVEPREGDKKVEARVTQSGHRQVEFDDPNEGDKPTEATIAEEGDKPTEATIAEEGDRPTEATIAEEGDKPTEATIAEEGDKPTEATIAEEGDKPTEATTAEEGDRPTESTGLQQGNEKIESSRPQEGAVQSEELIPLEERVYRRLFRYVQSNAERESQLNDLKRIISLPDGSLEDLFAQLKNKKVVVVWDEARGLFTDNKVDNEHSLVFRAVKQASGLAARRIKDVSGASICFMYMDTNAKITNFLKPVYSDPSGSRPTGARETSILLPSMTPFTFVCHHDAFIRSIIIDLLKEPKPINRMRQTYSAVAPDLVPLRERNLALTLLCGIGRPLYWDMGKKAQTLADLIDFAVQRFDPVSTKSNFYLPILAARVPLNIPGRCIEAYSMASNSSAMTLLLSPDHVNLSVEHRPELLAASACSALMQLHSVKVFDEMAEYLSKYGPEAGLGGELFTMMMSLASIDKLTEYKPHLSVDFETWLFTFLGNDSITLPDWCRGSRICLSQFVFMDLEELSWFPIELARIYGVGIIPRSRKNKGYDLLIPFELADGSAAVAMISVKNTVSAPSNDHCSKLRGQAKGLFGCRNQYLGLKPDIAACEELYGVLPFVLCLAHGHGSGGDVQINVSDPIEEHPIKEPQVRYTSENWEDRKSITARAYFDLVPSSEESVDEATGKGKRKERVFESVGEATGKKKRKERVYESVSLTDKNTWAMRDRFISFFRMLADDKKYVMRGWRAHADRFALGPVDFQHYVEATIIDQRRLSEIVPCSSTGIEAMNASKTAKGDKRVAAQGRGKKKKKAA